MSQQRSTTGPTTRTRMTRLGGVLVVASLVTVGCSSPEKPRPLVSPDQSMQELETIIRQRVDSGRSQGIVAGMVFPDGSGVTPLVQVEAAQARPTPENRSAGRHLAQGSAQHGVVGIGQVHRHRELRSDRLGEQLLPGLAGRDGQAVQRLSAHRSALARQKPAFSSARR